MEIAPISNHQNYQQFNYADKPQYNPAMENAAAEKTDVGVKQKKATETDAQGECQTCKNRRYQDGSDDPGVSFKAPGTISPAESVSAVYSHEREHFSREAAKAQSEGKKVVSNSISLRTAVCPECGRVYAAGGETRTVTKTQPKEQPEKVSGGALSLGGGFDAKI
ncbi:MAG: hypothetical protein LBU36_01950 [Clostridiales bacterium]|jgi:adenine-specific DNA methylase|nr:hypothetical protein [Clostridiales bacterium]